MTARKRGIRMIRVIIHGCCGRMGHILTDIIDRDEKMQVVAGVDAFGEAYSSYPVYKSIADVTEKGDVVIDFSTASAIDGLLEYCVNTSTPVVLCTTGLSEEQTAKMHEASKEVAILKSANMSLGINLLQNVLKEVSAKLTAAGFDVDIVEKHHNQKLDAPSGTAIALADSINESLDTEYAYVYDRSTRREKRPKEEIGISAVRGGTIVGDHDVIFAGEDEVITFSHRAYSRAVFGNGAVQAAKFLAGKAPGMFTMNDVLA